MVQKFPPSSNIHYVFSPIFQHQHTTMERGGKINPANLQAATPVSGSIGDTLLQGSWPVGTGHVREIIPWEVRYQKL